MGTEGLVNRRRPIPLLVKLQVALRQLGYTVNEIHWDHTPPLALREWDPVAQDTIPAANDPNHIRILRIEDHKAVTTGRRGESDLSISFNGDVSRIAKARRLSKEEEAFRKRLLAKEAGQPREKTGSIKSRGFERRPKEPKRSKIELQRMKRK